MGSTSKFRWSDQIKTDLFSIVNGSTETKIDWSNIAAKFKELHPQFCGSSNALRMQYRSIKTKTISDTQCSNKINGTFFWCDKSKNDLVTIVKGTNKEKINWADVSKSFMFLYPQFNGTSNTLKMQYRLANKNSLTDTVDFKQTKEKFVWSNNSMKDLLTIVHDTKEGNQMNWSVIAEKFKQLHPRFEGTNNALKMKYRLIDSDNVTSTDQCYQTSKPTSPTDIIPFTWGKYENMELTKMVNQIKVLSQPNWTKIWYTFKNYYPNYEGSKTDIKCHYEELCNNDDLNGTSDENKNKHNIWDETMDMLLANAIGQAQHIRDAQMRDGRKKHCDNLAKMTVAKFKELFKVNKRVEYIGTDAIIYNYYYDYKEFNLPCSYTCDEDLDSVSNCDHHKLQAYASKNHTLAFSKVFKECCHNCGVLFPRSRNSRNQKMLTEAINGFPQIAQMRNNVPYAYKKDEKYITCLECFKTPNWQIDYSLASLVSDEFCTPNELFDLNEYEQNQIALCGGFYSLYQKQNNHRRIFEHRQGECNIGKKRDEDYQNMFTYFNIERPQKLDTSNRKIKTALCWLKRHNRLYQDFFSNYETIHGYLIRYQNLRPEERIIQISKGNLADMVGKDAMGILIPADNVKIESEISPDCHKFGIQHPMQQKLNSLRSIINVTYSDPDLEAKRWPHLFPEGNGSWKTNSALKQQTYVKHRLLGLDSRFRKNNEFMFFWYDRLIKQRLLYFNNRQRAVNVTDLMESLHVKDLRESVKKYGTVVPSSIAGSKTYWNARKLDLLAMVRDLGKPALFVTLTQNDNWIELQEACGEISSIDLNILDQPLMQPAIGGKSVTEYPVETVVAFYKRFEMFMHSCIHNKNGPFGEVIDYWYRMEYQNRGALHCHMVLWICEETLPENVVMAEMPRYSGTDVEIKSLTFKAREYVKTFQMHTCVLGGCLKDIKARCKYGFPYAIQLSEQVNESKMGYTYVRRSVEDKNVSPYNIYALMSWNGHINVQKVTSNGIEAYLCKYVSKPEKAIDIKDLTSDAEKFLKARVVGILECCAHLLQFHQVGSSRKTLFLPCEFKPKHRMLKRKTHLPSDSESEDVYYQTLLHKYLVRPIELQNFTYVDLFRYYDVVHQKARVIHSQTAESQDESESEFLPKCDESQHEFSCRVRNIKSQRKCYNWRGYRYVERGKSAIPRWRFLMPFGNESEAYYEQRLLLNISITEEDLNCDGFPFSEENKSKTFVEECCIRGLVDSEETAKSALMGAVQRGFSVERVIEIATILVDQSFVTKEYVDSIIVPWVESMPCDNETPESDAFGEELANMLQMRAKYEPYDAYFESMTDSQKHCMEWVDRKMKNEDQILAILSGGAGVGKSYIIKALYSYFIEKKMVCILLATTGSAAYLISGTTVHYYLKMDIHGNKYLQAGTMSSKIVEDTDVIIIDEFSMLSSDLIEQLNDCTKEFGKSKQSPFGGKHVFLIGDPCQLPSISKSVFSNPILNTFSILLLKETVRQKDERFAALLNRVRVNMMTDDDKNLLKTRYTHVSNIECDDETLIVTATRKKMYAYNLKFIKDLPGDQISVHAQDFESDTNKEVSSTVKVNIRKYVNRDLWDENLILKEGCIVRLLRNIDVSTGWVNSKRAKVFRVANDGSFVVLQDIFDSSKQLPLTKIRQPFKLGANLYYRYQYPLILGYAITVHSVQGSTVTGKYYVDLDRSFWESGQDFVALSRPKELSQLFLLNTHFEKVILKPYYQELLKWMTEVDEISIMRKPRCYGDFPLIPKEEQSISEIHVFPNTAAKAKVEANKNAQFKVPRPVTKEITHQTNETDTQTKSVSCSRLKTTSDTTSIISSRMYKLAEAFNTACKRNTMPHQKIRFGAKFMDALLGEINDKLNIHSVDDPVMCAGVVTENITKKWDEQICSTLNLFPKYTCQFRAEFDLFANLVSDLEICKFSGQLLDDNFSPMYRDNQKWLPVRTNGDGRCLYHSISYNLIGDSSLSNSLKLFLAFTIANEFDIYESIFSTIASSASAVLLKSLSYRCWADMEILTAMSCALQRPLYVVSGLNSRIRVNVYNRLESENEPIYVGFVNILNVSDEPNHFIALLLDESYVPSPIISTNSNQEGNVACLSDDDVEMVEQYESLEESL